MLQRTRAISQGDGMGRCFWAGTAYRQPIVGFWKSTINLIGQSDNPVSESHLIWINLVVTNTLTWMALTRSKVLGSDLDRYVLDVYKISNVYMCNVYV